MSQIFTFTITEVILLFPFFLHLRNKHDGNLHHSQWYHQVKQNGNVINKTQDNKTPFLISIYTHLIIPKMRWYVLCNLPQWTSSIIIKNNSINVFLCLYRNCTNCYSIIVSSLTNRKSAVAWLFNVGLKKKKIKNKRFCRSASCFIFLLENSVYCKRRMNSMTLPDVISLVLT